MSRAPSFEEEMGRCTKHRNAGEIVRCNHIGNTEVVQTRRKGLTHFTYVDSLSRRSENYTMPDTITLDVSNTVWHYLVTRQSNGDPVMGMIVEAIGK